MGDDALFALWFFLPAGAANAIPVLGPRLPLVRHWNAPLDFGRTWHGHRILGDHKTWRGIALGILAATIVLWLQQLLAAHTAWAETLSGPVNYATLPTLIVGPLFAIGALGGDALKSFFKRLRGTPPGQTWFPLDQIDFIIGASIALLPFVQLTLAQYVWIFLIWLIATMLASVLAYRFGLKSRPI